MNWKFTCFVLIILIMLYFAVDEWQQYLSAKDRLGKNLSFFLYWLFFSYSNSCCLFSLESMVR